MSRNYDNWEKLVRAVLRKEKDRQLAYCESFSSSSSADLSSRFSLDLHLQHEASGQNIFFSRGVMAIKYKEIRNATTNFGRDMVLGEGIFGTVYKGWIDEHYAGVKPGSGIAVTVKELNNKWLYMNRWLYKELKEWMDEITSWGHRHPNLVTLIGYSFEFHSDNRNNRVLVYEHMPNGSLAKQLFESREPLSWATRIKVAVDVARGLAFLHALEIPVIHQNVRSSKIFLDGDFNAKLRYFDAKLRVWGKLHPGAVFQRAYKYADPMYLETGFYSTESDVYSFGLVLLELLSSLPAFDVNRPSRERLLIDKVKSHFMNREGLSLIMDRRLKGQYPPQEAYEVAGIALKCADLNANLRPRMAKIVVALEKLQYPSKSRRVLNFSGGKFLRYKF